LNCGYTLEFDKSGNVREVKSTSTNPIPSSVVSSEINDYVATNYPNESILGWELEQGNNQLIDLSNQMTLRF